MNKRAVLANLAAFTMIGGAGLVGVAQLAAAAPATGAPPVSLMGEQLRGDVTAQTGCPNPYGRNDLTFHSSGIAIGPYAGTYTADGSFTVSFDPTNGGVSGYSFTNFTETFTITAANATVTGTKSVAKVDYNGACTSVFANFQAPYQAVIAPSTGGRYQDSGQSTVDLTSNFFQGADAGLFDEVFSASNGVVPITPGSKQDCMNGGWRNYANDQGQRFQNQGQCVDYVNHHGAS